MNNSSSEDILKLICQGKTNKEISEELHYSIRTVERRISKLLQLYKVKNRTMLVNEYILENI